MPDSVRMCGVCGATDGHDVASIRAPAKALGRDCSNVHADLQALTAAGLLDATGGGVRADYAVIQTRSGI